MSASMHYLAGRLSEREDGDKWADAFRRAISWDSGGHWHNRTSEEFTAALRLAETMLDFMECDAGKNLPAVRAWAAEREKWAWQRDLLREELKRCMPGKPGARKDSIAYALEQTATRPDSKDQK